MTYSYDPLGRVPPEKAASQQPAYPPVVEYPATYGESVNTCATLSLVFAFVFAPVGAILGHLGLARVSRSGERGRNRALVGLTLSYVFIALAVVALITWAALPATNSDHTAAPPPTEAGPTSPTVAPGAVPALLPDAAELKSVTGDQNVQAGQKWGQPSQSGRPEEAVDRPECWGSVVAGAPQAYDEAAIAGYQLDEFNDTRSLLSSVRIVDAAVGFHDIPTARAQFAKLLIGWRQCGGRTVSVTVGGQTIPFKLSDPVDAGNGITTMELTPKEMQVHSVRAIATKANVIADVYVSHSGKGGSAGGGPGQSATEIAAYILNKVPG